MPLFIFAVLCFAFGILAGAVFSQGKVSRLNRLLKREHKHVMALENEIGGLRTDKGELVPAVPKQ